MDAASLTSPHGSAASSRIIHSSEHDSLEAEVSLSLDDQQRLTGLDLLLFRQGGHTKNTWIHPPPIHMNDLARRVQGADWA